MGILSYFLILWLCYGVGERGKGKRGILLFSHLFRDQKKRSMITIAF